MNNIILIGMPGAGKSTIGVVLAKALGMDFLDTDLAVCRAAGTTLQVILDRDGLEAFLDLEQRTVLSLSPDRTVIATGGSVPMEDAAMAHLKSIGKVVYLEVPLNELRRRLGNIKTRGIAFGPGENLDILYARRVPVYERWADLTVTAVPEADLEDMVTRLVEALRC